MTTADEIRGEMNEEGAEAGSTEGGTTGRGRKIGAGTKGRTMTEDTGERIVLVLVTDPEKGKRTEEDDEYPSFSTVDSSGYGIIFVFVVSYLICFISITVE